MQVYLNRGVQGLVIALILWCIYCATSAEIQGVSVADGRNWFLRFLFYWIILYQIIPISLYVFFEIVKLVLGFQINRDPQMVDPRSKLGATARTADLVEEMGQVNFVFSDKTGTLTENEMVFAHCCVCHDADARDLGDFRQTAKLVEKAEEPPGVAEGKLILSSTQDPRHAEVLWFFVNLATNHSVQVEGEGTNKKFEGSSADEVAFVEAAKDVGVTFVSRTRIPGTSSTEVVLKGPGSKDFTFTILCEIPFSSDRKRMSVIVKHEGEYWCLCKGADNIMGPLCDRPLGGSLGASLTQYSKLGLRTLVIASKKMDDQEFVEDWLVRWKEATVSEDREAEMARVASEVEHSLKAAGVTAIEDKLQDGVPEAITSIKAAGIRFWVLTGDKTETAVEIAKACKLFSDSMTLAYLVNCSNESQALQLIEDAKTTLDGKPDGGLVLDGTFVQQILTSKDGRPMLYELAMASKSC
ncbi:Phospholipid-transporting ATPase ID (ATPase class I type 8B member 2) (P4-ATPase flippase complex alpha subunit ATP8B2), partial [Durusdinium trenchii]